MKKKFIYKYMRLAKQFGEDSNPCLSRKIGVVIVDPTINNVCGIGYNGPPPDTPHCDSEEYLRDVVWPQITEEEKHNACLVAGDIVGDLDEESFCAYFKNCGTCPRKIIGAQSGERLEICSCEHAEKNAIYNANKSLHGAFMFCWCGCPCWDCAKAIIRSGIAEVYYTEWGADYSAHSRWLLERKGVKLIGLDSQEIIGDSLGT
jgi:deoxycytidylate deaminase